MKIVAEKKAERELVAREEDCFDGGDDGECEEGEQGEVR